MTKHLYQKYSKHPQVTDDFVVFIDDEEYGLDLIKRCVPARLFRKLFDGVDKPNLKKLSPEDRLAKYMEEIWSYEKEILAMGSEAIPRSSRNSRTPMTVGLPQDCWPISINPQRPSFPPYENKR